MRQKAYSRSNSQSDNLETRDLEQNRKGYRFSRYRHTHMVSLASSRPGIFFNLHGDAISKFSLPTSGFQIIPFPYTSINIGNRSLVISISLMSCIERFHFGKVILSNSTLKAISHLLFSLDITTILSFLNKIHHNRGQSTWNNQRKRLLL